MTLSRMPENPWVSSLRPEARDALFAQSESIRIRRGEMLYRAGDPAGNFYGLVSGWVKVSTVSSDGREAILTIMEPGNWFGEMTMVDRSARVHDATAIVDVELLSVRPEAFEQLMERADFANGIATLLAARMRLLFAVFEDATLVSTEARIARRLLHLSRGDASLTDQRRPVVHVSQQVLAMMLGITRQTLSVELQAMAKAGAISTGYGSIELVSLAHLSRVAGLRTGETAPVNAEPRPAPDSPVQR